ncbi:hypothetical protein COOONC_24020 [Cooperia oncophora]
MKTFRLSRFVVGNHMKLHPNSQINEDEKNEEVTVDARTGVALVPQDLLRKYIIFARENCHPSLQQKHSEKLATVFAQMRKQSMATGSVAITVRHVESMIRLSEAHAKLHLRAFVNDDDVQAATRIMLESFINTQKASIMRQMRKTFSKHLAANRSSNELLLFILKQLVKEQMHYEIARGKGSSAQQLKIENVKNFYSSDLFAAHHFTYDDRLKQITQAIF